VAVAEEEVELARVVKAATMEEAVSSQQWEQEAAGVAVKVASIRRGAQEATAVLEDRLAAEEVQAGEVRMHEGLVAAEAVLAVGAEPADTVAVQVMEVAVCSHLSGPVVEALVAGRVVLVVEPAAMAVSLAVAARQVGAGCSRQVVLAAGAEAARVVQKVDWVAAWKGRVAWTVVVES
jgi:hypothetical protein